MGLREKKLMSIAKRFLPFFLPWAIFLEVRARLGSVN